MFLLPQRGKPASVSSALIFVASRHETESRAHKPKQSYRVVTMATRCLSSTLARTARGAYKPVSPLVYALLAIHQTLHRGWCVGWPHQSPFRLQQKFRHYPTVLLSRQRRMRMRRRPQLEYGSMLALAPKQTQRTEPLTFSSTWPSRAQTVALNVISNLK